MTLRVTPAEIVADAESSGRPGLLVKAPSWDRVLLGDVARVVNGAPYDSSHFNVEQRGIPLVRIRDVGARKVSTWYDGEWAESHVVHRGDLLIGMDGNFAVDQWHLDDAVLNQRVCRLDVDERRMNRRFLELVVQGYLDAIWTRTSSTTVKHLSSKTIAQIPLPAPPLDEQRRIVEILEEHLVSLDFANAALDAATRRAGAWLESVLRNALTGGDRVSFTEMFESVALPAANVEVRTASEVGRWPVVDQGAGEQCLRSDDKDAVYTGPLPAIVFGDHTRRIKIVREAFAVGGSGVKILVARSDIDAEYAYWAARAVALPARGYGRHFALLRSADFSLGPLDFQQAVVRQIREASETLDATRRLLAQAQRRAASLRRALLQAAFSGQLTGRVSDFGRAEALVS